MSIAEFVANRIKEFRTSYGQTGLSQEALAKYLGVATNTVCRWETGQYRPSLEDLERLARFMKKALSDFLPADSNANDGDERVAALLRTAKDLPPEDLIELQRYAEFRRARNILVADRRKPGRRRKAENED